ncbi:Uncharacterised protein [Klebsiella pneumoniae subsp. ozaenae]|uniref:Uncharacterized protein n=1 Tax=Klebsiella pneumoniae subsp. ozaenae TaxID=574 RepID=A0A378AY91_KLEPO|nr:Uncharacterised protein [Klebsiella pneumoniae subsp. ozaenae]
MVNLEQIKADIAARKAMPAWGPQTSIERIKTINATLPSFSLKTVEALVATLDVQSGRSDGNKFALVYSSAAHKLPDDVYFLYCRARPAPGVPDNAKLRELFDSWFASDCSFDRSPEASEADNIAWRESYWYVWQCCSTAILTVSQLEGL